MTDDLIEPMWNFLEDLGRGLQWDAGAVIAGVLAAVVAVRAYRQERRRARRDERAQLYAGAIAAVEDYMEGPYRVRRRDGSHESRRVVTEQLSDVKSRINQHEALLQLHAPDDVRDAYERLLQAAYAEAGSQMTQQWEGRPTRKDRDVPVRRPFPRRKTDAARVVVVDAMRADLHRLAR